MINADDNNELGTIAFLGRLSAWLIIGLVLVFLLGGPLLIAVRADQFQIDHAIIEDKFANNQPWVLGYDVLVQRDIVLRDGSRIDGRGYTITLDGCSIVSDPTRLSSSKSILLRQQIQNATITRIGSAGPAIWLRRTARFTLSDLSIKSTGTALRLEGSYLGKCDGIWIESAITGIDCVVDSETKVGVNAVSIHGGELKGCQDAVIANQAVSLSAYGVCVEGNVRGITLRNNCKCVLWSGAYFEGNSEYHVRIAPDVGQSGQCNRIESCNFQRGRPATETAIRVDRTIAGDSTTIVGCNFQGFTKSILLGSKQQIAVANCWTTAAQLVWQQQ